MRSRATLLLLTLLPLVLHAQAVLTVTGPSTAKAGTVVPVTISISGPTPVISTQWVLNFPAGGYTATVAVGSQATASSKGITCVPDNSFCLLSGLNANVIPSGSIAVYSLHIPAAAPAGNVVIGLAPSPAMVSASATGTAVFTTQGAAYTLTVLDHRDLNSDGSVTAADVGLMLAEVLNSYLTPSACVDDQNADGACNVVDVSLVLLKFLGILP